jgi:RNA polymerase subunit RPABC4/transcription elongation factor Spt4
MMNGIAVSGVMVVLLILVALIPILIGLYVYKDAKSRRMDAVLWTLVAILVPSFVGLIIYLVIRSNNSNLNCPACHSPIAEEYALCPYCGQPLKASCPTCAAAIEGDWKICPKCGAELALSKDPATVFPKPKKDRKLILILLAAIIVPLTILVFASVSMFYVGSSTFTTAGGLPVRIEDAAVFPAVAEWIERCEESGQGLYVLEFSPSKAREFNNYTTGQDNFSQTEQEEIYCAVVYINYDQGEIFDNRFIMRSSGYESRGNTLEISYETTALPSESFSDCQLSYALIISEGITINKTRLLIDGREAEYSLSTAK